jgi:ubiquinone/menaquinone biosynthesis C-methylase UbiE
MDDLLQEQIEYYRARGHEFDEWYERKGFNDFGERWNAVWFDELARLLREIDAFEPRGRVLELACGTGWWTKELARYSSDLTAVDASPEALEVASSRAPHGRFVHADLFEWQPDERYDVVFFSFWLSHVPIDRFNEFWDKVGRATSAGGRVFFIDNLGRALPDVRGEARFWQRELRPDGVVVRTLNDGSEYRIVKHYHAPEDLEERLSSIGWDVHVSNTEWFFYFGHGGRRG